MSDNLNRPQDYEQRLALAETRATRAKAVMDSLAGFCHALGQPATVLMSSIELLRMEGLDRDTRSRVLDMCYEAVIEIRSLLGEMKARREYVSEAYLAGNDKAGDIADPSRTMPQASWDAANRAPDR